MAACRTARPGGAAHADIVYMGGGARTLYTAWTPLGDVPLQMGPLALCLGSHRHEALQSTYCTIDTHSYLSDSPDWTDPLAISGCLNQGKPGGGGAEIQWASADMAMGDILLFSAYLLHAPLVNHSDRVRLSSDTRYFLAADVNGVDSRHMGPIPDEFPRREGGKTMRQACEEWGLAHEGGL